MQGLCVCYLCVEKSFGIPLHMRQGCQSKAAFTLTTFITALAQAMHKWQGNHLQPPCACSSGASPGQHPP